MSNRYPFRLGCIADVGQTFNSSTTLQRLLVSPLARTCRQLVIAGTAGLRPEGLWRRAGELRVLLLCLGGTTHPYMRCTC